MEKQNLLLLHGAIGSSAQLQLLTQGLKETYTVYTLDFSGHGGRKLPTEDFSIELFANDVLQWMGQHSIDKINIFGYSMGGYVALYLARHYPGKIEKVFTLATKLNWTPEIAQQEVKMLNPARIAEKLPAFAETLAKRHAPVDWKIVLERTAGLMLAMGSKNPLSGEDYNLIQQTITFSVGDHDKMVSLEETIAVYRQVKNASLLVLPATTHPIEAVGLDALVVHLEIFFA